MFNSILDDIRSVFRVGNMIKKLLLVNFMVFIAVQIVYILLFLTLGYNGLHADYFQAIVRFLAIPADVFTLLWRPWTLFSHMFLHQDIWHVLSNIIWLSIFGTIVGDLIGDRRVLPIYLMGGLAGAVMYMVSANLAPSFIGDYALGASAAVMAFAGAALILAPDYRVMLFLLGEIKLKYIVLVMVLLDLVGFAGRSNAGGHAAHIGGFVFGVLFVYRLRDGHDLTNPVNNLIDRITGLFKNKKKRTNFRAFSNRPQMEVSYRQNKSGKSGASAAPSDSGNPQQANHQERLDAILDKIKAQGFENLTPEEKDFLYEASKK
jgi:membrane associated rhomboid family serine protease